MIKSKYLSMEDFKRFIIDFFRKEIEKEFDKMCKEISEFLDMDINIVRKRMIFESLMRGINVLNEAIELGLNFHIYDEKMEKFYQESTAFIFETAVESLRPDKQFIMNLVKMRVDNYIKSRNLSNKINILMFGEGIGSDAIYLYNFFKDIANLFYFDVPSSRTFEFTIKRFKKRGIDIKTINDYNKIPKDFFDIVISLEVLEHLPDPVSTIKDISDFLHRNGIALITESFGSVYLNFPTHLKSNLKFEGKTPFLFLKNNLVLSYFNRNPLFLFRPMEFAKVEKVSVKEKLRIIFIPEVLKSYLRGTIKLWLSKML